METPPQQLEKERRSSSSGSGPVADHREEAGAGEATLRTEMNQKLANPLAGLGPGQLAGMGETYCRENGITADEDIRAFRLGAVIAGNENRFDGVEDLTANEREVLEREITHKWSNPGMLYWVVTSESHPRTLHNGGPMAFNTGVFPLSSLLALCRRAGNGRDGRQRGPVLLQEGVRHRRRN